ncbi:MAG: TAXI family TRAP transporter solute-binding subunit [Vicinamibacterales bacterium]
MTPFRTRCVLSTLAGAWLLTVACQRAPTTLIGFAGGPTGGSFFPAAGAISAFTQQKIPNLTVSVEGTGGSGENVRLVGSGDGHMGIAYGGDAHQGYFGEEDFAGAPQNNLRAVGLLFWGYSHLVVLKDSGIRSVADLANKRIAIGGTGSGSALAGERIFRHLGLLDKMKVSYLGGSAASEALKDGQVDSYHWQSGAPNAAVLDTVATHAVDLLDLAAPARASGFADKFPYYLLGEIPAGAYKGIDKPVPTVVTGTYWIVHKDVPENIVYEMTRAAYSDEGHQHMEQTFRPLADMTREQALKGLTIPLHPGAQRFWQELGIPIPDSIRAR